MDTKEMMDTVTQRVKETANVGVVFGEPIETQGITIIPVATVKVAGGGGGGMGRPKGASPESTEKDKGMGLGLRITTEPVGYIEVIDGQARMVDIIDKNKVTLGGLVIGGLLILTMTKFAVWKLKRA